MKGAAAPIPNNNLIRHETNSSDNLLPNNQERLQALGFEEGELEMFFETTNYTEDQLINKYLEIAQGPPFNLNWRTENIAANAPYMLNVFKPHGTEYTKHDIVEDTLTSLYEAGEGGAKKKTRKNKTRRNKTKRNKTRRNKNRRNKIRR